MERGVNLLLLILIFIFSFLFVYAANEQISPSEVDILPFTILRDTFNGITTDFTGYTEEEYRNFTNVILEKTSYGKVEFEENLDLVTMAGIDWIVDFDSDVTINSNLIHVDQYSLPGIIKSALISFYGIGYSDAEIYHNGIICGDCTLISHSGTTYTYRTPAFSGMYYLREVVVLPYCGDGVCNNGETFASCPADCNDPGTGGGGGGGGGGGITPNGTVVVPKGYDFYVEPTLFEAEMGKGTYYQKMIKVVNNGTQPVDIGIGIGGVQNFVFSEVRSFSLQPNQSRELRFDIYASQARAADVYLGNIQFVTQYLTRETKVILNVLERDALFDLRTVVNKKYIPPGGRVIANVTIINMGDLRDFDVHLDYKVMDFDKNEYSLKQEDFAIEKYYNGEFFIDLPKDIPIGTYIFHTRVSYNDVNATAYDTFVVERVSTFTWILLIIIILLMMYLAYRIYLENKHRIWLIGKKKKDDEKEKIERERKLKELKKKANLPGKVPEIEEIDFEEQVI